jgi:hypothetical protein
MLRSVLMMFGMNYLFRRMNRGSYAGSGGYGTGLRRTRGFGPRW